ncbi:MAG: pentapeptide repeat-containing protein [Rhodovibrionaceae bacterium]
MANKNPDTDPWYVFSTIMGAPEEVDDKSLVSENREFWNRCILNCLPENERQRIIYENNISKNESVIIDNNEIMDLWGKRIKNSELPGNANPPILNNQLLLEKIDWKSIAFKRGIFCERYVFPVQVDLQKAKIEGYADFRGSCFLDEAFFIESTFYSVADFAYSSMESFAIFDKATFRGPAIFSRIKIGEYCSFSSSSFEDEAAFINSDFPEVADFSKARFSSYVGFNEARFPGSAEFMSASFNYTADFSTSVFAIPPTFDGRTIHPDTIWPEEEDQWPSATNDKEEAKRAERTWSSLRLAMNHAQRHNAEMDFFGRELDARRVHSSFEIRNVILLYKLLSDYGRSVSRPLYWWLGAWFFAFSANYWLLLGHFPHYTFEHGAAITDFTLGNALSLGGTYTNTERRHWLADKVFGSPDTSQIPWLIDFLSLGHSIASLLCIFLIGLALRNRLRIK